jgi:hypothetical protein
VVAPTFLKPNYAALLSLEGFGTAAQKKVPSAARQAPAPARLPSRRCASATRRNSCPRSVVAGASFRLRRDAVAVATSGGAAEAERRSRSARRAAAVVPPQAAICAQCRQQARGCYTANSAGAPKKNKKNF